MKKLVLLLTLISCFAAVNAQVEMPQVHAGIMLDLNTYRGEGANIGSYNTSNRFQVRKAAITVNGRVGENVDYAIETGICSCVGGGTGLQLLEAEIDYHLNENISLGIKQGHVLRGFAGTTECLARIPMERPVFSLSMTNCHPTGFVANFQYNLPYNADIEFETAFMNGDTSLDGEKDYNFGTIINTPISGLAVTGVYNLVEKKYYLDGGMKSKDGYRAIGGLKYDFHDFNITAEYYTGKGFQTKDTENDAYYILGSYRINTNFFNRIEYLQPYARYSFWDKAAESNAGKEYDYLDLGLVISLDAHTKLKFNYTDPMSIPSDKLDEPATFTARIQVSI
ncbi:hypothetical protein JEZ13_09480 [bacterium]|nr:hypothetical protein [bacterium]